METREMKNSFQRVFSLKRPGARAKTGIVRCAVKEGSFIGHWVDAETGGRGSCQPGLRKRIFFWEMIDEIYLRMR